MVASRAPLAAQMAKRAVLAADEVGLSAGLDTERRLFELALATEDRVEGMQAFIEKRKPDFKARGHAEGRTSVAAWGLLSLS